MLPLDDETLFLRHWTGYQSSYMCRAPSGGEMKFVQLCVPSVIYVAPERATARSMHATVARQSLQAVRQLSAESGALGTQLSHALS